MNAAAPLRISAPGNLLLLGEYAVLEEGGLGVAAAVEPRVRLEAAPGPRLRAEGAWPGGSGESPFVSAAVAVVSEYLGAPCTGWLRVDSAELFGEDGAKTGLGSSAAVSVALVCGLLALAGKEKAARGEQAAALSVRAHRLAQGGAGSGYDVLASFHGGCGVFRGGAAPSWEPVRLPTVGSFILFRGPAPVSTAEAVRRFARWKEQDPRRARAFRSSSDRAIQSFLSSRSEEESLRWFAACRKLGIELGASIGVPADLAVPQGLDPGRCKAIGAGNELGICLLAGEAPAPSAGHGLRVARVAESGVTWEQ